MKKTQREKCRQLILSAVGGNFRSAAANLTAEQKHNITERLYQAFKTGELSYRKLSGEAWNDRDLRKRARSLLANSLRVDYKLNGGIHYVPANVGPSILRKKCEADPVRYSAARKPPRSLPPVAPAKSDLSYPQLMAHILSQYRDVGNHYSYACRRVREFYSSSWAKEMEKAGFSLDPSFNGEKHPHFIMKETGQPATGVFTSEAHKNDTIASLKLGMETWHDVPDIGGQRKQQLKEAEAGVVSPLGTTYRKYIELLEQRAALMKRFSELKTVIRYHSKLNLGVKVVWFMGYPSVRVGEKKMSVTEFLDNVEFESALFG